MFGKCSYEVMSRVLWPGIGAGDTSPCWWWGQVTLWRCSLFHPTPQGTAISSGNCKFLPSPKWVARSLSLLMKFVKLPLKPLSRGAAHPGAQKVPHPVSRGRQEARGNYLFLFLPHPSPCMLGREWMDWHHSPQAQLLQSLAEGWEQWPWLGILSASALVPAAAILVPSLGIWT